MVNTSTVTRLCRQGIAPMNRTTLCLWCHSLEPHGATCCRICGHNPTLPRAFCDCQGCEEFRRHRDDTARVREALRLLNTDEED